jgi:translation elongation factor EF-1alpha
VPAAPVAIEVDEDSAPYAVAGQNVTLYLSGIDPIHLAIGTVLCPTSLPVPLVTQFTAQILVFDLQSPIIAGTPVSGRGITIASSPFSLRISLSFVSA